MKKINLLIIALFVLNTLFAQKSINNYKYVLLPEKFDFLKKENQYRLNTQTRYLLKQKGFTVLFNDEVLPNDLAKNNCLALRANVLEENTMFKSKLKVQLTNCNNQVVLESELGESKEKEYAKSYQEALNKAFASIDINYEYIKPDIEDVTTAPETSVKEEIISKPEQQTEVEPATSVKQDNSNTPSEELLYAQPISNGYQLVNAEPKVVMVILKTSKPDIYLVQGEDALIYKENNNWYYNKATETDTSTKKVNIKF